VIAASYERIHRSNLVGMGVLPLQFREGEGPASFRLTGREQLYIDGVAAIVEACSVHRVRARRDDGSDVTFEVMARIDSAVEVDYYRHGGILHKVLRSLASAS
jgi:aconitate hydratase